MAEIIKHNFNVKLENRHLKAPLFERLSPATQPPFQIANPDELEAQIPIYTQDENDCTANSWTALATYLLLAKTGSLTSLSRRFVYEEEDMVNNEPDIIDEGANSIDGATVLKTIGICKEELVPYGDEPGTVTEITDAIFADAATRKFDWYYRVKTLTGIDKLLSWGWHVSIGVEVFDGTNGLEQVGADGILGMPEPSDNVLGGHEVCIVSKVQKNGIWYYKIRNSWGATFGDNGYFYAPVEYLNVANWDGYVVGWNDFKQFQPTA